MDYIPVYHWLRELFPQVDSRMLEVTAKYSKDADAAVEFILTEVLPVLTEKAKVSSRSLSSPSLSDVEVEQVEESSLSRRHNGGNRLAKFMIKETVGASIQAQSSVNIGGSAVVEELSFYDAIDEQRLPSGILDVKVVSDMISQDALEAHDANENQITEVKELSTLHLGNDNRQSDMCGNTEAEKLILVWNRKIEETVASCPNISCITTTVTTHFVPPPPYELASNCQELETVAFSSNNGPLEDIEAPLDHTDNTGAEAVGSVMVTSNCSYSSRGDLGEDDGSTLEMMAARSEQICSVDLLEQIIDDAKNNKKTLFSAVESVINMMKEVEHRERAAEVAKEEAEVGGVDMLTRVMELQQMLVHAKDANDMHAGEVYGEKAVLVTEVRELQSRLCSLSDERDKALAVLDEMSKIMETRIAEADEERLSAEKEKLKKEEKAHAALAEQQAIMEKVVQESKIFQEAAEENSKLREFLMDRGHVVDILQGEISVICQDVRLLKEKFDAGVPLSQSVSSSQTSCLLASSSSSLRSLSNSLNLNDGEAAEIPEKIIEPMPFGEVPQMYDLKEERERAGRELEEMGWEFFDKEIELNGLFGNGDGRLG